MIFIVVPVRANKSVWLLGDTFLTDALPVLMQIQSARKDEIYLFSNYDMKAFYPPKLDKFNFARQIRMQLANALEEHNRLPEVIILIIGNMQVERKIFNPVQTRRVWGALFKEIDRMIKTRKDDLPKKCFFEDKPKVYCTSMFPKYKGRNDVPDADGETFKSKRHRFNNLLPQIGRPFGIDMLMITGILPDEPDYFELSTGKLSGKGMSHYWQNLSKELKFEDQKCLEAEKSRVIKEYFEKRKEQ